MIPARLLFVFTLACLVGLSACSTPEPVAENQPVQPVAPPAPQEPSTPPLPAEQLAVGQLQDVNLTEKTLVLADAYGMEQTFTFSDATEVIGAAGAQGLSSKKGNRVTVRYVEQDNRKSAVLIQFESSGS
jgi:hypothetical protein